MPEASRFDVHVADFDGPLALLLHLIKQSQMSIYDIQIEAITNQYLRSLDQMDTDVAGEYFVLAADLMAIKAQLLLPKPAVEEDEPDPREDLVQRLVIYQAYQRSAHQIKQRFQMRAQLHSRVPVVPNYENGLLARSESLDVRLLQRAFSKVVQSRQDSDTVAVSEWQYSVEERTQWLLERLPVGTRVAFAQVLSNKLGLEALVTTFLALLELVKQQVVAVVSEHGTVLIYQRGGATNEK